MFSLGRFTDKFCAVHGNEFSLPMLSQHFTSAQTTYSMSLGEILAWSE